jgi:hypothetical protein
MTGSAWADISDEAKDFVKKLLNKCVSSCTLTVRRTHILLTCRSTCIYIYISQLPNTVRRHLFCLTIHQKHMM